jgi:hypothetical protein
MSELSSHAPKWAAVHGPESAGRPADWAAGALAAGVGTPRTRDLLLCGQERAYEP